MSNKPAWIKSGGYPRYRHQRKERVMANIPPWIKSHPILGSKANRLDPAAWLIAADWHEDRGEQALADSVRGKARLFAGIMEAIGRLSGHGEVIYFPLPGGWSHSVSLTKKLVLLWIGWEPAGPVGWTEYRFHRDCMRDQEDYIPSRLVNEVLA